MKDWTLEHPYLTFFLVLFALSTISSIFNRNKVKNKQLEEHDLKTDEQ